MEENFFFCSVSVLLNCRKETWFCLDVDFDIHFKTTEVRMRCRKSERMNSRQTAHTTNVQIIRNILFSIWLSRVISQIGNCIYIVPLLNWLLQNNNNNIDASASSNRTHDHVLDSSSKCVFAFGSSWWYFWKKIFCCILTSIDRCYCLFYFLLFWYIWDLFILMFVEHQKSLQMKEFCACFFVAYLTLTKVLVYSLPHLFFHIHSSQSSAS